MIWELRHEHKVGLLIDIAKIPRSTYYYYSKQFDNPKPDKYAEIKVEIRRIYDEKETVLTTLALKTSSVY